MSQPELSTVTIIWTIYAIFSGYSEGSILLYYFIIEGKIPLNNF